MSDVKVAGHHIVGPKTQKTECLSTVSAVCLRKGWPTSCQRSMWPPTEMRSRAVKYHEGFKLVGHLDALKGHERVSLHA